MELYIDFTINTNRMNKQNVCDFQQNMAKIYNEVALGFNRKRLAWIRAQIR